MNSKSKRNAVLLPGIEIRLWPHQHTSYMKVLEKKVMRGPNFWSNYRHFLIVLKLDLEELEEQPTNCIEGFAERLELLMPSLISHRCSHDHEGGFFERVREGTWMGHVVEHIALELQTLAGMDCGFGRTRGAGSTGVYHVVFAYEIEEAGLYAAEAAVRLAEHLIRDKAYNLEQDIAALKRIRSRLGFGPSTQSIINEAKKRKIPFRATGRGSTVLLGQGVNQKLIRASMTSATSHWGVEMAGDKEETKRLLEKAHVPVPRGEAVATENGLKEVIGEIGFPLVIKPIDGNHGRGITTNIESVERALQAFQIAKNISHDVLVERFLQGDDYRFLVINYKLVAVAKRTPAMVIGDGTSTILQLVEQANADPRRGEGHEKVMTTIKIDQITETLLASKQLTTASVLPIGECLFLKDSANLSAGGTATDVTDVVHPANVFMAERIAQLLRLDICGIDIVAPDVTSPVAENGGGVVEVNACPGFRMHLSPSKGLARNVAEPVMQMLYPPNTPSRIPLIAITGTNGKTTTTRLTAHLAKTAGHKVGYITTDGIYIHDHLIYKGDCTGSQSAATVLSDPTVDYAVLECARGGILRSGLGFDHCDISIVTNISEDHLGLKGVYTLEDMARVKAVVPRSTFPEGYAILNADDDLVFSMAEDLDCQIALFSTSDANPRVKAHCAKGGLAAVIEKGCLTVCKGEWKIRVAKINSIPLSFGGAADCMIKNILPATLTGIIRNFKLEDIRTALQTFVPSAEQTPGRMNLYRFRQFDLMLDYAHNTGGFIELKAFMSKTKASHKIGIITGVGDRRDADLRNLGALAGDIFDDIIIRFDKDMRGRPEKEMAVLLTEGIMTSNPQAKVSVVPDERDAIEQAMVTAPKGSFVFVCTNTIAESTAFVKSRLAEEQLLEAKLNSLISGTNP